MLKRAIEEYGVYSNAWLRKYIYDLECRFKITDEVALFKELVNFSKNTEIPYHGWFKYREGFSHTLIKELIKRSGISKDEYVLDPFCGSGTTVVEAALNGYSGIGIDINPMSAFLSEVKSRSYSNKEIEELEAIIKKIECELADEITLDSYLIKYEDVKKFFNENNYRRLLAIRQYIDREGIKYGMKVYELLLCAYICIIEEASDRKRDGNGLKTLATKISDVEEFYIQKVKSFLLDIKKYRIKENLVSYIDCGDAMKLSETVDKYKTIVDKTLGAIIYSPPYANSFDYFESYKMEVILADYAENTRDIGKYRTQAIESFIGRKDERTEARDYIELMAKEVELAIPDKERRTGKKDNRTRKVPKMIKGYFSDMEKVIAESSHVLESGKKCYIVVDQSTYLGKIVPTDLFLATIAEDYDFKVNEIIICRNAKTAGQQSKLYPYLKEALRESIVVLEKK